MDALALHQFLFSFTVAGGRPKERGLRADVRVDAGRSAPFEVSRRMFGKFTEHLGSNVYQGAWAQLTLNPGCEPAGVWGNPWGNARASLADHLNRSQARWGLAGFGLDAAERDGLGFWWKRAGTGRFGRDPGVNGVAQRLGAGQGADAVMVTPVFPPVHRCREVEVSLWAKVQPGASLTVSLGPVDAKAGPFSAAKLKAGAAWTRCRATLAIPKGALGRGEPALLAVRLKGGTGGVDQVFAFPADHLDGWDPDVVRLYREAGVSLIRFPGGNFVSGYRWEDGVGPVDARPVKPNPAWGGVEWNHVGTDEWLRFCGLVGAEPMICVNAGDGTEEEAARWVRHCRGKGVRLWEVGNELYGAWQIGWTDAKGYAGRYASFARAMRRADRGIRLIACGDTPDWNAALLRRNGKTVRSISVHWLPLHGLPRDADAKAVYLDLIGEASNLFERVLRPRAAPMARAGAAPKLALDELQILNHFNATAMEALVYSAVMNEALRAGNVVELVTHSALINHGGGLVKRRGIVAAQPVHWAVHLYGTHPGVRPVPVGVLGPAFDSPGKRLGKAGDVSWLDAAALIARDRKTLVVFLTNRHPSRKLRAEVALEGFEAGNGELAVLAPPSLTARAEPEDPEGMRPARVPLKAAGGRFAAELPPHSLARAVLRRR